MLIAKLSSSLKAFVLLPYFLLIVAGLMIPSDGSHGFLSIKSLAFIGSVFCIGFYILLKRVITFSEWKVLCFLMTSLAFLMVWMSIGLFYGEAPSDSSWEHFKITWLTISVVVISTFLVYENLITFPTLLKTVFITNFIYSFLKVSLVLLHLFSVIDLWSIVDAYEIRFMSMDILGTLPRFQTSIDIVTPFLLLFFLQSKQFGISWSKSFKVIYILISVAAIFLSFSRFLTFIAFLAFTLHALTLNASSILRIIPVFITICAIIIGTVGTENIYNIVERRFFSSDTWVSDLGRKNQTTSLLEEFYNYPILGKGLGGYAPNSIRDPQLLYSYEVQWVASLMQFGLVGLSFIILALGIIGKSILSNPLSKQKLAFFILFLSWLASGFMNPFLLSLTSGIVYSIFFLAGEHLKNDC